MTRLIGVDIGGTNTDLIYVDAAARKLVTAKVPTTAENQALGLVEGIDALGADLSHVDLLIHGTTVATNAAIERKGARCGLITTAGFRDVLELRRRDRPHTYGLRAEFAPLVPRRFRREVAERMSAEGETLVPLDEAGLAAAARELAGLGCEVVVLAFLHAYANPAHERRAREVVAAIWPNDFIVLASDVLPAMREFERTSTAVISGYVQPLIGRYFDSLGEKLAAGGLARELLVVQSNGGVMAAPVATRFAANTILSGPAAGVTAAAAIAGELGLADAVSCDMGGTSLDICVIRNGQPPLTQQKAVDFGIPIALPMLDIDAIGAGGGSLARIDKAGLLQVGPESAGSSPGPIAYGKGGTVPTVTDASLVLGLLQTGNAIGKGAGAALDKATARAAIGAQVGEPLGVSAEAAAEAILTVTGAKMAGHVRRKLLERGLDPRDFSMIAFGGAGPLHANRLLREIGLKSAVIPIYPGITSAMGCILGNLRHDFMRTVNAAAAGIDAAGLAAIFGAQADEGRIILLDEGATEVDIETRFSADMCYRGQSNVIPVAFPPGAPLTWEAIHAAFDDAYRERFGRLLDGAEVVLVNARTTVTSGAGLASIAGLIRLPDGPAPAPRTSEVFFAGTWIEAALHERLALPAGTVVPGPALLLQPDSTTFVEPGYAASVDPTGHIILAVQS
ncbi:hydantoinase/oxoprolinase family protein [Chelatococcus reniformis]|uniref:Hydantoinase n=1 Tax=Chelatococcus reniformis TaxID=1494448 RepID=A0A916UA72_9HYPH|nr:hydantoinase/oxoprolinase family protein [Chelatococcus reniformis]GGC66260.1 hydantoinase [Chelatococcus reniformis]